MTLPPALVDGETTIVFLPGMQCTTATFADLVAHLRRRRPEFDPARMVIAPITAATLADAARAVADLGQRLLLVGHSLGGTVAMATARLHPDRVAAMALLCTNPKAPRPDQRQGWHRQGLRAREDADAAIDELLPALVGSGRGADADAQLAIASTTRAMMVETGTENLLRQLSIQQDRIDERPALRSFRGPVLAVAAHGDHLVPVDSIRTIADTAPYGELHVVDDAGHMLPLEQPHLIAEHLDRWITRIPAGLIGACPR